MSAPLARLPLCGRVTGAITNCMRGRHHIHSVVQRSGSLYTPAQGAASHRNTHVAVSCPLLRQPRSRASAAIALACAHLIAVILLSAWSWHPCTRAISGFRQLHTQQTSTSGLSNSIVMRTGTTGCLVQCGQLHLSQGKCCRCAPCTSSRTCGVGREADPAANSPPPPAAAAAARPAPVPMGGLLVLGGPVTWGKGALPGVLRGRPDCCPAA